MSNSGKILAALAIGAVAGTVLGVLFAPDKGSETRKKISGKASSLGDEIKNRFNKTKVAANEMKERVMNMADDVKNASHSRTN